MLSTEKKMKEREQKKKENVLPFLSSWFLFLAYSLLTTIFV